ncbi:POZ [Glarea lozoyensis ATCC 20868]|uniref:POZ n=1 Tax=Glarea lozoyensis (strain ATCC 20868 / MF5171) TaxID=1116229 RepID=S3DI50_GLAL2|nr:POZ [Glarea lozoyensis ATCC 20868]EPE31711.1 POZ [Glarea lozoyensis ATCC 20868]
MYSETDPHDENTSTKAPQTNPINFSTKFGNDLVQIIVGKEERLFTIHKTLLCNKIPYFSALFNGSFAEAAEKKACFPDDEPGSYDVLFHWVYTGVLPPLTSDNLSAPKHAWNPVAVFSLADRMIIPELMDSVMDAWILGDAVRCEYPGLELTEEIYDTTPEGSASRKYLMMSVFHMLMYHRSDEGMYSTEAIQDAFHENKEFCGDVLTLLRNETKIRPTDPRGICAYNFHVGGVARCGKCNASVREMGEVVGGQNVSGKVSSEYVFKDYTI